MDINLHSLPRQLIDMQIEHADLDSLIDLAVARVPDDDLALRRLKKRRLQLRDRMARIEAELEPRGAGLTGLSRRYRQHRDASRLSHLK